jgi:putative membrane protein
MDNKNVSDHLANERTFLAWIRTGIGIMAFGFVVVKFSLFLKQLSLLLNKQYALEQRGLSSVIGIILVAMGAASILFAYTRYRRVEQQIRDGAFQSSTVLLTLLTASIFLVSILLIVYLIQSI